MASPVYRDRLGYWRRKCPGRPDLVLYASFATLFTVDETTALGENETGSSSDGTEVCLTRGTHIVRRNGSVSYTWHTHHTVELYTLYVKWRCIQT